MRFAVLPERETPKSDNVTQAILDVLQSGKEMSFAALEQALSSYPAMTVRKAVWYLSSLGRLRITPAMTLARR